MSPGERYLKYVKDYTVIKPIARPREHWEEAFRQIHKQGDEQLIIDDVFDEGSFDDWK